MSEAIKEPIDIKEIMEMIPHRYPFLLIDRVIECVPGERAVAIKNVTVNEPQFMGHFPGNPIMPGVLLIEAMAQAAAVVVIKSYEDHTREKRVYFMTIDNTKFRRPVVPGDQVEFHVEKTQARGPVWKFTGKAYVDGNLCAEGLFGAMITDAPEE